MLPVHLVAENLDDAWHQALHLCFKYGYAYTIEHGSYEGQTRYEFDFFTARVKNPGDPSYLVPIMPEGTGLDAPTSKEYVQMYFAEFLMADTKTDKEDYRYGERLVNAKHRPLIRPDLASPHVITGDPMVLGQNSGWKNFVDTPERANRMRDNFPEGYDTSVACEVQPINQVDEVIRMFAERGGETNQATMEIAMPPDILLADPPCCRMIDCRVRNGKLHFFIYFRSWDLYGGFPANLGGMELLKQYMVNQIKDYPDHKNPDTRLPNLDNGEIYAISKGLHIYDMYAEIVENRFKKSKEQIRAEGERYIQEHNPGMICVG